jgi:hypothetical protein
MTRHELAIARTVIYAGLFDYPLTLDQLHQSLIESNLTPSEILSLYEHSDALQHIVDYRDGFFFPAGRAGLVAERRRREGRSRAFLERHRFALGLVSAIPFTKLVALSGSVAHMNLEPDGDLDLFIITRGARVWTVTLAVLLLTKLLRCRRVICANFVIADSHLTLDQEDLFTANQVIHLKPLVGAEALAQFAAANPFVKRFYPNAGLKPCATSAAATASVVAPSPVAATSRVDAASPAAVTATGAQRFRAARLKAFAEVVLAIPSPLIEAACRSLYGWHLRRRASSWRSPEQVSLQSDYLKLHTKSHRRFILDRFDRAVADAMREVEQVMHDTPARIRSAGRR